MRGQRGPVIQKGNSYLIKYRGPDGKQKCPVVAPPMVSRPTKKRKLACMKF